MPIYVDITSIDINTDSVNNESCLRNHPNFEYNRTRSIGILYVRSLEV